MDATAAMNVLAGFTADQWGLVTTAQATGANVDSLTLARLVDTGLIEHVRRGVYAVTAAPEDPQRAVRAAWLQLNARVPAWERALLDPDGGVLSHGTAAQVHDLGDLLIGAFQFTVPRRRTSRHPDIAFRHLLLAEHDVIKVDGLPVTTVERTIADLLADHVDGGHMGDMIYRAIRRGQVEVAPLAKRVGRYARRYGVGGGGAALVHALLDQADKPMPMSALESSEVKKASAMILADIDKWLKRLNRMAIAIERKELQEFIEEAVSGRVIDMRSGGPFDLRRTEVDQSAPVFGHTDIEVTDPAGLVASMQLESRRLRDLAETSGSDIEVDDSHVGGHGSASDR